MTEIVSPSENNQSLPTGLERLIFWLAIVLASLAIILMVGEIRYIFVSKNAKPSTSQTVVQNTSTNPYECNTDVSTWKSSEYTSGNARISFKYPSCWQRNTDDRFDKYAPVWHYVNSSIDLTYSDPNKLYKGPEAETEEKKLSSFTIGRGNFSLASPAVSKNVEQTKIAGYPATKTIYKGSKGDTQIDMFSDTGILVKVPDQIQPSRIGIAFTIQYYDTDKTDYSKIADLIGSTFEIKQ